MRIADGFDHSVEQMAYIIGHEVGQRGVLGVAPQAFDRIEVGSVRWQPFHMQPIGTGGLQSLDGCPVHVEAIEHHECWRCKARR